VLRTAVLEELARILGDDARGLELERFLGRPPRPELGDLAFGCFPLAKAQGRSPAEVAAALAPQVRPSALLRGASALGPYLNFQAEPQALLAAARQAAAEGALQRSAHPRAERVMIEFSQPNTHKPFHVGHLRNVVIGDSLVRLHRACGREVIAANYYGDYGIDVAKCLWWLRTHPELVAPSEDRTTFLGQAYVAANEDTDTEQVRAVLHAMETHEPEVWALYQRTRQWCLDEFADTYRWLGVRFDVAYYESEMEGPASEIVDRYLAQGVFVESDGAIICDLCPDLQVPALLRKRDGTSLYMTWDLALAARKFDQFELDRALYVVGAEQRLHFQQLFLTLQRMGYARAKDCQHVAYELVTLPDGKMSARKGTAVPLSVLRREVAEVIAHRLEGERSRVAPADREEAARRISVACLKYGMLSVGPNKRVVFDLQEWVNPQGDTGAYLMYGMARIRGLLREARERGLPLDEAAAGPTGFGSPEERELLGYLLELPAVIERAADHADPSVLAGWVYDGMRAFSRFWDSCRIFESEPALCVERLQLVALADRVMTAGLDLLGLEPVDAM
jgi:arginyl-tRNA synthetase